MPLEAVAGSVASRWASRPVRPWRSASVCSRRSKSVGTNAIESPSTVAISARVARDHGHRERVGAREDAEAQPEAEDDQRSVYTR